jgi:hypothetical protein
MLGSVHSATCWGRYQVGRRRSSNNKFLTKMVKRGRQSTSNWLGVCAINLQIIDQSNGRWWDDLMYDIRRIEVSNDNQQDDDLVVGWLGYCRNTRAWKSVWRTIPQYRNGFWFLFPVTVLTIVPSIVPTCFIITRPSWIGVSSLLLILLFLHCRVLICKTMNFDYLSSICTC